MVGPLIFWLILSLLQFSRQNFCGQLRLICHRNDYSLIRRDFRLEIKFANFNFALHFQFIIDTVDGFLHTQKSQRLNLMDKKLSSDHRRSLVTMITYHRPLTEKQVVRIIALIVALFTLLAVLSPINTN